MAKVPNAIELGLRSREAWKYEKLRERLNADAIPHIFEYQVAGTKFICDLALPEKHKILEFDDRYHNGIKQKAADAVRDTQLRTLGWEVIRISVLSKAVLDPTILEGHI